MPRTGDPRSARPHNPPSLSPLERVVSSAEAAEWCLYDRLDPNGAMNCLRDLDKWLQAAMDFCAERQQVMVARKVDVK